MLIFFIAVFFSRLLFSVRNLKKVCRSYAYAITVLICDDYSLSCGDTCGNRDVPCLGRHGRDDGRGVRAGEGDGIRLHLGGGSAHSVDEAVERHGKPWLDGRCDKSFRRRLARGAYRRMHPGQHRHYVLYSCRVLRQRGRENDALCSPVRADG